MPNKTCTGPSGIFAIFEHFLTSSIPWFETESKFLSRPSTTKDRSWVPLSYVEHMEQIIKDIALLLGGWTAIITGIISFISYLATQRIIRSWDLKNQKELETLRNYQADTQLLLKDAISTISSSLTLLQARRVEAVDKLQKAILLMKQHFSPVTFFFFITLPHEYNTALNNLSILERLRAIDDYIVHL